jgi:hypothetical protein
MDDRTRAAQGQSDGLELVAQLWREAGSFPRTTVLVELATVGPLLNLLVGGRGGVPRHREGIHRDEERFIPLYRSTLDRLLAGVRGRAALMRLVDRAIAQDHLENARLLDAFDLLDPPGAATPRVMAATRHAAPAAGHAVAKFTLLVPAVVPAVGVVVLRSVEGLRPGARGRAAGPTP